MAWNEEFAEYVSARWAPLVRSAVQWQLVGVPRSPDLLELAKLEVELQQLPSNSPDGTVSGEDVFPLQKRIEELKHRLFPPNGNLDAWLKAQAKG
jgi:hypothetical protein